MSTNYDGLTRNPWPGTWSSAGNQPIVLDTEIRGGLRLVSGILTDQLTDIPGQISIGSCQIKIETKQLANFLIL